MVKDTQDKPWFKNYRMGRHRLAQSLAPYPRLPLYAILEQAAERHPASVALEFHNSKLYYSELKLKSDNLAAALAGLGVRKGDRVATVLPTCPQYVISAFAILKAGAIHVPCSTLLQLAELEQQLTQSGARILIITDEYLQQMKKVLPHTSVRSVIVTSIGEIASGQPMYPLPLKRSYIFSGLINRQLWPMPRPMLEPRTDLAYLAFTGGATGRPKGVMLTHYNRFCNVLQGLPWMLSHYEGQIRGQGTVIIAVPLFHSYGDWVMLSAIYWGLKIVLVEDPRDVDNIASLMKKHRPFLTSVVPTQLLALRDKKLTRFPGRIISGASHLPAEVRKEFTAKTRIPVSQGYGLTEAGPLTHMNLGGHRKHGIGVPVPDTEVVLINELTGRKCRAGEAGHMYIKGPQVMKGYWPKPGSGLIKGWLPTGDIARMDNDGYFYLEDRIKDMINVSGYKVYPRVIEDVLYQHPAISQAVVIGVPDPERVGSERVKAFVQLKSSFENKVTAADIINFCKERCSPYAVPTFIEFKDKIPLTATQKPFKRKLKEEESKKNWRLRY
ncbi:MAG TPA: AMP-binding protein [Bacillota bacterium]|nr:AMP-binding protein [Bacillota bacterium]